MYFHFASKLSGKRNSLIDNRPIRCPWPTRRTCKTEINRFACRWRYTILNFDLLSAMFHLNMHLYDHLQQRQLRRERLFRNRLNPFEHDDVGFRMLYVVPLFLQLNCHEFFPSCYEQLLCYPNPRLCSLFSMFLQIAFRKNCRTPLFNKSKEGTFNNRIHFQNNKHS